MSSQIIESIKESLDVLLDSITKTVEPKDFTSRIAVRRIGLSLDSFSRELDSLNEDIFLEVELPEEEPVEEQDPREIEFARRQEELDARKAKSNSDIESARSRIDAERVRLETVTDQNERNQIENGIRNIENEIRNFENQIRDCENQQRDLDRQIEEFRRQQG